MSIGYEQVYQLRTCDFDRYRRPRPASVLDIFQDVAGVNAESMPGMDLATMDANHFMWVLTRVKYEVVSNPALHEQVKVHTWPLAPTRMGFQREYTIESLDGQTRIQGSSDWVVLDWAEHNLVPIKEITDGSGDYATEKVFPERLKKIRKFEPEGEGYKLMPTFTDIDMNGHVNNTKYGDYALDALELGPDEAVRTFQIDYRHELHDGEHVMVYTQRREDEALVMGMQGEEVAFMVRIELA